MISSLVITDKWNIPVVNNKIKLPNGLLSLKDIPFIRYRFERYGLEEQEYINQNFRRFEISTHLAEVKLYDGWDVDVEALTDKFDNLVVFVYVDIDNEDVINNTVKDKYLSELAKIKENSMFIEKIILHDISTSLHVVASNKIKRVIVEATGIDEAQIGICNSPLSYTDGNACLTAMCAREISAKYNEHTDCPLPSANHEMKNGNGCGCIKYEVVDSDLETPTQKNTKKPKAESLKQSLNGDKPEKEKKSTVKKPAGKVYRNFTNNW